MRIFIYDNKTGGKIVDYCKQKDINLLTPEEISKRTKAPSEIDFFLDEVDLLIIEITKPNQEIQFILAQAILAQKPTLCLYAKNQPPRELLSRIKQKSAPRPLKTFSYTENTLIQSVNNFIARHDPASEEMDDVPTIKYTLRLTPRIERYLNWYSAREGISKADLIRDILVREANDDSDYQDEEVEQV